MKNVDFVFVYEVKNREFDSICLLGAYLESLGYKIGYVNSWDSIFNMHENYSTKVVVLSASYNDAVYDYFTSHVKEFQKVLNLLWEQVLVNNVVYGNSESSWDYSGIALTTRHICWGKDSQERLHNRYGIDNQYLKICGYLPLDFYDKRFDEIDGTRETLFSKYGLSLDKKTILFVSSFSGIGLPKSQEAIGEESSKEKHRKLQVESQNNILNWLEQFALNNSDYQVVYRPHPTEANNPILKQKEKDIANFRVISEESIRKWIKTCDILCNWQSTSMIEMYLSGKKTLLLRPVVIPFEYEMPIFKENHYSPIESFEQFETAIKDDSVDFPVDKKELLYFYDMSNTPTYKRIGDYLVETLKDNNYKSPNRNKNINVFKEMFSPMRMRFLRSSAGMAKFLLNLRNKYIHVSKEDKLAKYINDHYTKYDYFWQKMRQNRSSDAELRNKINAFKEIIKNQ